jgi:hypothetical protein
MEHMIKVTAPNGKLRPGEWLIPAIRTTVQPDLEEENVLDAQSIGISGVSLSDRDMITGHTANTCDLVMQALVCLVAKGRRGRRHVS